MCQKSNTLFAGSVHTAHYAVLHSAPLLSKSKRTRLWEGCSAVSSGNLCRVSKRNSFFLVMMKNYNPILNGFLIQGEFLSFSFPSPALATLWNRSRFYYLMRVVYKQFLPFHKYRKIGRRLIFAWQIFACTIVHTPLRRTSSQLVAQAADCATAIAAAQSRCALWTRHETHEPFLFISFLIISSSRPARTADLK